METTHPAARDASTWQAYQQHGYFFREAAIATIALGFALHLFRVIAGDGPTLQYVMTPTTDLILMVPMIYAAVSGWLARPWMRFSSRRRRLAITAALVYITISVPLHLYFALVRQDVSFYVEFFPPWFSYLLLIIVYPIFLTMLWRLRYKES